MAPTCNPRNHRPRPIHLLDPSLPTSPGGDWLTNFFVQTKVVAANQKFALVQCGSGGNLYLGGAPSTVTANMVYTSIPISGDFYLNFYCLNLVNIAVGTSVIAVFHRESSANFWVKHLFRRDDDTQDAHSRVRSRGMAARSQLTEPACSVSEKPAHNGAGSRRPRVSGVNLWSQQMGRSSRALLCESCGEKQFTHECCQPLCLIACIATRRVRIRAFSSVHNAHYCASRITLTSHLLDRPTIVACSASSAAAP